MVCIDTWRILDSCRDKDCFESVRAYVTNRGQEIIDRTTNIRVKSANVVYSYIDVDNVPFNRGFYQLNIKIYCRLCCEACLCPGNIQEFDALAVVEKKVVLFGSEGGVHVFKTGTCSTEFCKARNESCRSESNMPVAVFEVADPIVLAAKVMEPTCRCLCCCGASEVPENVCDIMSGPICDDDRGNKLILTLGFFSVVRIERPAQLLVNATEYSVPDKECIVSEEDDPCKLFRTMAFPTSEFQPPAIVSPAACGDDRSRDRCGCGN
jgi:hypothetical protein